MKSNAALPTPLVIDVGSWTTKSGFGGEDAPRHEARSIVGRPRHPGTPAQLLLNSNESMGSDVAGENAVSNRGLLATEPVLERGVCTNWVHMEQLLHSTYTTALKVPPEDHPLIITEQPDVTRADREKLAHILFETLNVPAVVMMNSAVLTTFSSGRTTGIAVESGAEKTHVVPVWEGYAMPHATMRMNIGGNDVTWALAERLRTEGYAVSTALDFENLNAAKEATNMCYVAKDYMSECDKYRQLTAARRAHAAFALPDGNTVHVADQRFLLPEMLFRFDLIPGEDTLKSKIPGAPSSSSLTSALGCGDHFKGLTSVLVESVRLAGDISLRQELFGNIVLGGGNSLLSGFDDRLQREIAAEVPGNLVVRTMSFPCRKYSSFLGASCLSCCATLPIFWASKSEYEENGAGIVHQKQV